MLLLGTLRPLFLHTTALESESYEFLQLQGKNKAGPAHIKEAPVQGSEMASHPS